MKTIFSALARKSQFGEGADLFAADGGLAVEGKGFQRPAFGQVGAADFILGRLKVDSEARYGTELTKV